MNRDLFQHNEKKYGSQYKEHLLEQYKLYLAGIEKISDRRLSANNYFIAVNTALLALVGFINQGKIENDYTSLIATVSTAGIIICIIFWFLIRSYKQLNTGKFEVLHKIEEKLPLSLYKFEWQVLKEGKSIQTYFPFSHIEGFIPWVFGFLYIIILIACR
jgi:hypothetical protein